MEPGGRESLARSKQQAFLPRVSRRVDLPFCRPGVWAVDINRFLIPRSSFQIPERTPGNGALHCSLNFSTSALVVCHAHPCQHNATHPPSHAQTPSLVCHCRFPYHHITIQSSPSIFLFGTHARIFPLTEQPEHSSFISIFCSPARINYSRAPTRATNANRHEQGLYIQIPK